MLTCTGSEMQLLNLIVSCSNRKKAKVPEGLRLRSIPQQPISNRLAQWQDRLQSHETPLVRATDLYAGEHWQVAQSIPIEMAPRGREVRLWICSAGYGLVRQEDELRPYSATFTPRQLDSVSSAMARENRWSDTQDWWSGLCAYGCPGDSARSIREIMEREPQIPMIIVASEPYLIAMEPDIAAALALPNSKDWLSILSCGAKPERFAELAAQFLPADARFESIVGGTRSALNARVVRHLLKELPNRSSLKRRILHSKLEELGDGLPDVRRFKRKRMTDIELKGYIESERQLSSSISKSSLLRKLRDEGRACEQQRFSILFDDVVRKGRHGT
jgi:hypothetical protein